MPNMKQSHKFEAMANHMLSSSFTARSTWIRLNPSHKPGGFPLVLTLSDLKRFKTCRAGTPETWLPRCAAYVQQLNMHAGLHSQLVKTLQRYDACEAETRTAPVPAKRTAPQMAGFTSETALVGRCAWRFPLLSAILRMGFGFFLPSEDRLVFRGGLTRGLS